jgi:hypothetical protein
MLKKTLSKITTNMKTLSNESNIKDSFISEKLNLCLDTNEFKKINKHNKLAKSENIEESKLENNLEENEIIAEFNEYSIFNSLEENQLRKNNDNKQIYNYLIKNYKTRKDLDEFINFFYPDGFKEIPYINEIDFYLVGVFEDLAYYPIWMSDDLLLDTIKELKSKYEIYYWRRVKGDGNCYYRSVLINYIEILIIKGIKNSNPNIFFCFIKEIFFTKFPKDINKFKEKLILTLLIIYEQIEKKSGLAFDILYRTIHKSKFIEKILIYWFKLKLSQFLQQNINLEIDGLKLVQVIPEINFEDENISLELDNKDLNNYIDNKILKMDEYVEGYPIYITPFILKCKINIYSINKSIDAQNKNSTILSINKEKIEIPNNTMFIPVIDYLPYLNNEEINLLFKSPHYDSLSKREYVNNLVDIYNNPYIILVEGILTINEYEQYKTSIVENWNSKKFFSKKENGKDDDKQINKKIKEEETALKMYENLNEIKDTCMSNRSNYSSKSSSSIQLKYIECLTRCNICNQYMNHKLPCGCFICSQCSKNKILMMKKNNDIEIPISLCSCGYILNDKDKKLLCY